MRRIRLSKASTSSSAAVRRALAPVWFQAALPAGHLLLVSFIVLSLPFLASCGGGPVAARPAAHGRWVSLSPSMTEVLFAVGAGPEVAGVCAPASYPPEARVLPTVASWDRVDVEAILALHPRACFTVEGMQSPEVLATLRRLGVPVFVYPMRNLEDLWRCMTDVGERTGHGREAGDLVSALQARVRAASPAGGEARLSAVVVVGLDPLVAAGHGSFLDGVLRAAGYANALGAVAESYPALSVERVAEAEPEVLIMPQGEIPAGLGKAFAARLRKLEGKPVREVWVPADLLVRPGPRTVEAIEALAAARRGVAP
ncbi:MAG: ABC transporter substrate-binding protein [Acidobacteriota bacterium]